MRKAISLWALAALLLACEGGWRLPLQNVDGSSRTLKSSEVSGRRIYINYWAEWCEPCRKEIPELNRFAEQFQGQAVLLGRNFDNKQGEELKAAMHRFQMNFPAITVDPATVFTLPEIPNLPATAVLDDQGRLISILWGPQDLVSLEAELRIE